MPATEVGYRGYRHVAIRALPVGWPANEHAFLCGEAVMIVDVCAIVRDGAMLSALASALILGTLRANPRLFLRHFPDAVRATQAPLSTRERLAGRVVAFALVVLLVGFPIASTRAFAMTSPDASVVDLFVHAFAVGMFFNLVDWLVIDEAILGLGRPRWAAPTGVDPACVPFEHARHFRGFLSGTVLCAVVGVVAAVVSGLL